MQSDFPQSPLCSLVDPPLAFYASFVSRQNQPQPSNTTFIPTPPIEPFQKVVLELFPSPSCAWKLFSHILPEAQSESTKVFCALLTLFTTSTTTHTCNLQPALFHGYHRDSSRKAASPDLRGRPSGRQARLKSTVLRGATGLKQVNIGSQFRS